MTEPNTRPDHKKQLEWLHRYLDEDGWDVTLRPPNELYLYDMIALRIFDEDNTEETLWTAELTFLPVAADNLTGVSILQCFVPLANQFASLLKPQLYEIIAKLNLKLPLVGFGFYEEANTLYYKCNIMLPDQAAVPNGLVLSEAMNMITYMIATFTLPIVEVASGAMTVDEAIDRLNAQGLI